MKNPILSRTKIPKIMKHHDSHNIYVLGLLFFVPASVKAEYYKNDFSRRLLPPETLVVVIIPLVAKLTQKIIGCLGT